jgi:hypothetical protein
VILQQPSAAHIEEALARVYARAEFTERRTPALVQFMRDLWNGFREWIASLWEMVLPERSGPIVQWLLYALVAGAALWALTHLILSLQQSETRDAARAATAAGDARARDVTWWENAARAAAQDNRFRDAALFLYNAVLLRLEARGELRYHPGKTPGDYRREVRAHARTRTVFEQFIRALLPAAFGARTPDAATFETMRAHAAELGVHA